MSQIPVDCLNEIFEYLDMKILHSCLLVNNIWCEYSLRLYWKDGNNYNNSNFCTLIACLPKESKEILNKNRIIISTLTSKPPMFNYASFCRILLVHRVYCQLEKMIYEQHEHLNFSRKAYILAQEIFKLFTNQNNCLKELIFYTYPSISYDFYIGEKGYLKNLSKLCCCSNISAEFWYQLSRVCHKILSLKIFVEQVLEGLTNLISVQRNLKCLDITNCFKGSLKDIISLLTNPKNLSKLYLDGMDISLSLITKFTNLQELILFSDDLKGFENLQYIIFPQLQILKINHYHPKEEVLIKFLENNGKNLKEIYMDYCFCLYSSNSLKSAIVKFCPNLKVHYWNM